MGAKALAALVLLVLGLAADARSYAQAPVSYRQLAVAAEDLRAVVRSGGWPHIPPGPTLREGDGGVRVAALRRRLVASDGAGSAGGDMFDGDLRAAVERTQRRHGLEVDGVVGRATLDALNVSATDRLRQVEVNFWRAGSLPTLGAGLHILINLPAFRLTLLDDGAAALEMPIIVGRPDRATPLFSSEISELILNPDWTVPKGIARRDILARARRDPHYLAREGFVVYESWAPNARRVDPATIDWRTVPAGFSYKFRQEPGPTNALGRIKFLMSSPYDIYLHDTPQKELFGRSVRALSNGCIRLADAMSLASHLMAARNDAGPSWAERRDAALSSGQTTTIRLPRPVPVHIVYFTAWVDPDGSLNLRDDIYGYDAAMERALLAGIAPDRAGCGINAG